MNDWKVIPTIALTTVLIFGAGVFTGGFLVNSFKPAHNNNVKKAQHAENPVATNSVAAMQKAANSHMPEIFAKPFLQRLDDELHLTSEQHDAVQKIISDGQNEMRKVVQDSRLEIRDVLSSDQQKQFDELVKRPFKKPLFSTNSPAAGMQSHMNPEEQVILMEKQRAQAMDGTNASAIMPPPPQGSSSTPR